jgi:hypothetical protein
MSKLGTDPFPSYSAVISLFKLGGTEKVGSKLINWHMPTTTK